MTPRHVWGPVVVALLLGLAPSACRRTSATPEQCGRILDRIVELELGEQGFRDQALAGRKKLEMRQLLAPELRRCVGGSLGPEAIACVNGARTIEELSHMCLR